MFLNREFPGVKATVRGGDCGESRMGRHGRWRGYAKPVEAVRARVTNGA